jgi:Uma2 family endonuclease
LLSIEEYLHTSYSPDVHFVDGEIEERNLGEYEHAKLQALLAAFFTRNEDAGGVDTVVEQRIRVGSSRVRVCDLAVLRADAPREEVTATPPILCIEILSPDDRLSRAERVLADYFAMGVPNIWLIGAAYTYGTKGLVVADSANLSVASTPIHLDLTEAFAKLDKKASVNRL